MSSRGERDWQCFETNGRVNLCGYVAVVVTRQLGLFGSFDGKVNSTSITVRFTTVHDKFEGEYNAYLTRISETVPTMLTYKKKRSRTHALVQVFEMGICVLWLILDGPCVRWMWFDRFAEAINQTTRLRCKFLICASSHFTLRNSYWPRDVAETVSGSVHRLTHAASGASKEVRWDYTIISCRFSPSPYIYIFNRRTWWQKKGSGCKHDHARKEDPKDLC